ncbi:MAG: hypothetical protein ACJ71Z_10010 [Aeromicrobium sp.]
MIESPSHVTGAILRPGGAKYDVEREYTMFGFEQQKIWQADGSRASRPYWVRAEAVSPQASTVRDLMDAAWNRVRTTGEAYDQIGSRLQPFAPQRPFEAKRYVVTWVALVLGDIVGIFGAALSYGEIPANALGQAISSGVAAVTGGLVGADVKNAHVAKAIRCAATTDHDYAEYGIVGVLSTDRKTYGLVLRVSAASAAALVVGIFALRLTIEGLTGGLVFCGLSLAVAAASFINAWVHANPAADLLEAYKYAHEQAQAQYLTLGAHQSLADAAAAESEAALIEAEHNIRGQAALHHVEALKWGILRRHPQLFGHGRKESPEQLVDPPRLMPLHRRSRTSRNGLVGHHE